MLGLSEEFTGHQHVREELTEALKQRGSLKKDLAYLAEQSKNEKAKLIGEIAGMESEKRTLTSESVLLSNTISQLQSDLAYEEMLRQFHRRYSGVSPLLEWLATWDQIFFMRCNNPAYVITGAFDAHSGNAHFWTDKQPAMCPQCGHRGLVYDEGIYQSLNRLIGDPQKIILGE